MTPELDIKVDEQIILENIDTRLWLSHEIAMRTSLPRGRVSRLVFDMCEKGLLESVHCGCGKHGYRRVMQ